MRDILLVGIIVVLSVKALSHPWVGVLAWTWISVMNPHSYSWAAASMPVAAMVAGSTLLGLFLSRDTKQYYVTRETGTLMLFMAWVTFTHLLAFSTAGGHEMWTKVMKIDLMVLVTIVLLHTKQHVTLFVWVIVASLGFYGVKGGLFTLTSGGNYRVWGPGGFIGGNNELALALIMVIPLMRFLQLEATNRWLKHGLTAAMLLTATAALGSHSRGALLAIAAMAIFLWWKSPRKLLLGIGIVMSALLLLVFMPESWEFRMNTIATYEQDQSAMGRINAWSMAWNLATDRLTGGGFDIYNFAVFSRYAPDPTVPRAAHSIYFQVLGEHGFIGLFIFLTMWLFVWLSAGSLIRETHEDMAWCRNLGAMCQVSLVGYAVGGAFLSLAYFDLPYNLLALVVITKTWVANERRTAATQTPSAPTAAQGPIAVS